MSGNTKHFLNKPKIPGQSLWHQWRKYESLILNSESLLTQLPLCILSKRLQQVSLTLESSASNRHPTVSTAHLIRSPKMLLPSVKKKEKFNVSKINSLSQWGGGRNVWKVSDITGLILVNKNNCIQMNNSTVYGVFTFISQVKSPLIATSKLRVPQRRLYTLLVKLITNILYTYDLSSKCGQKKCNNRTKWK